MGDGKTAGVDIGIERLHVLDVRLAGGRVAIVADGNVALELFDDVSVVERVADKAQVPLGMERLLLFALFDEAMEGYDAGAFLATVLERVKAERRQWPLRRGAQKCRRPRIPRGVYRRHTWMSEGLGVDQPRVGRSFQPPADALSALRPGEPDPSIEPDFGGVSHVTDI